LKGIKWVADVQVEVENQYVEGLPEAVVGVDLGKWHNCYSIWINDKEAYRAFDSFGDYHRTLLKIQDEIGNLQANFEGSRKELSKALTPLYEKKRMVLRQYYGTLRNRILEHIPKGYNAVFVVEDLDDLPRAELSKTQRTWACAELANGIFANQIEWNGYKLVKVNPRGTTHTCWKCGKHVKDNGVKRKIICPDCYPNGLDRDLNGARNIAHRYMRMCNPQHTCSGQTPIILKKLYAKEGESENKVMNNEPPMLATGRLQ
jgi:transposase